MHPHCYNGCPEQQKPYCRCVYERRRARHARELSEIEMRLGELRRKQTEQVMLRRAILSIAAVSVVIPGVDAAGLHTYPACNPTHNGCIQPATMYRCCHARSPPSHPPSPTPVGVSRGTCQPRACGHHRLARQRLSLHGVATASARTAPPPRRAQRRANTTTAVRVADSSGAPSCTTMWVTLCWCTSSLSTASRCTMPSR